jgi:putative peptide zinc metalloprotease protein
MTATELLQARPCLRSELRVSRPLLRGPARIRLLLDPATGTQMEIAAKVHFVMDRLDGVRTLDQIGDDYAAHFGTRLGEPQWRQLLGLLYGRRLLADTAPTPAPPALSSQLSRPTLLEGRTRLLQDTPALIERLHRATRLARSPFFLVPLLLLLAAMLTGLALQLPALVHDTAELGHRPLALVAVVTAIWVSMALHELGHGLVGRAAGGTVSEIGVRWRLPMVYLYCDVDDVRFLRLRRQQLATAAAGVLVNLVVLLPAYLVLLLLGGGAQAHPGLGALLLLGSAAGLANLLPLPPLDGYRLLEYLLGTAQLSVESARFARLTALRLIRRGPGIAAYPRRSRLVLGGYALVWTVLTSGLLAVTGLALRTLLPGSLAEFAVPLPAVLVGWTMMLRSRRLARTFLRRRGRATAQGGGAQ